MVNVIAHRGWWTAPEERNTLAAFARAFDAGIGAELDVRDWQRQLVVSHDPPHADWDAVPLYFREVLDLLAGRPNVLAVNVKACGLAPLFAESTTPPNWFFFDLPPYEHDEYAKHKLPVEYPTISNELFGLGDGGQWESLAYRVRAGTLVRTAYLITDRVAEAVEYFK